MEKNHPICPLRTFFAAIKHLPQILIHSQVYFENSSQSLFDGIWVILFLFVSTFCQKLLWVDVSGGRISTGWALEQALVNSLLAWSLFLTLFYILLALFKKNINLSTLVGQTGVAGLPLAAATLISALSWLIGGWAGLNVTSSGWYTIQSILTFTGLALSWTGLFGYFLMNRGYHIKQLWAALISGGFFILLLIGTLISS